jgi:uncharacterized protein YegL
MSESVRPGGALASRDMHFIWIVDGSTSMRGEKIQSLNYAIANALPEMRVAANSNPYARVLVRAVRFANDARWMNKEPIPVAEFQWRDIEAEGETAMGEALVRVAQELASLELGGRFLPPVLILVTDGHPTDDFDEGLRQLLTHPLGRAAIRLAVAIGSDADLNRLQDFIANPDIRPLQAGNSDSLAELISFASKSGISLSSTPASGAPSAPKVVAAETTASRGSQNWVW